MQSQQFRKGLFVSYSEKTNGSFQDAVDVCDSHGHVVWLENFRLNPQRLLFPTTIVIKIKGEDRYYQGELENIESAEETDRHALLADVIHRPVTWQRVDEIEYKDFKSVLYIAALRKVPRPSWISKNEAPQAPKYVESPPIVPLAEEIPSTRKFIEGAKCRVTVNAYERNPAARNRCLEHHGRTCVVCGFDFGAVYGSLAEGFIHVHHVKPLSEIGEKYKVDPIVDLQPVCPNCHAVIHLSGGPRSISEVKQLLQGSIPSQAAQ